MNLTVRNAGPAISVYSYAVAGTGDTSLIILRAVESTVDALVDLQKRLEDLISTATLGAEDIRADTDLTLIDSDDRIVLNLEKGEDILSSLHSDLKRMLESTYRDRELNGDHEDAVATAFTRAIDLVEVLYDANVELRWAVMEHDANADDEIIGEFTDVDSLMEALRA